MLETISIVTIIILMIVTSVIAIVASKVKEECKKEKLQHPERIKLRR